MPFQGIFKRKFPKLFCFLIYLLVAISPVLLQSTELLLNETMRLPNTSFPRQYNIQLTTKIHRGDLDFKGNCTILVKVIKTTDHLVLHARNLSIEEVLVIENEHIKEKLDFESIEERDFLILTQQKVNKMRKNFESNTDLRIQIKFSGKISESQNDDETGFKKIEHTNQYGREVIGAYTLFEPDLARTVFPCYDEPAFKAHFVLQLTHGSNLTAISNAPQNGELIKSASNDNGMVTTRFLETPIMSTYLLAFILSDFQQLNQNTTGNIPKRIFTPNDYRSDIYNIFNNTDWALKTMERLFDIPHHLQKLDSIIISYTDQGMENWGLIYYNLARDYCNTDLCFSDDTERRYLIFHEIAHQWFGNLVTLEWWSYLWLNEGMATYYGYVLTELKKPEDRALDRFRTNICIQHLMKTVNCNMTTYIENNVNDIFHLALYHKAACVIQMFEHAFGQKIFRKGVSNYLKANFFSSVNENDLFEGIQFTLLDQADLADKKWNYSVHDIMRSWTHTESFPTIYVERNYDKENSNIIKITQIQTSGEQFWIPLTFATKTNPNFENTKADYFMSEKEIEIDLSTLNITLKPEDWLIVNKHALGYYIVQYDDTNLSRLNKTLDEDRESISALNRALLYGNMSYNIMKFNNFDKQLLETLKYENDPLVWLTAIKRIRSYYAGNGRRYSEKDQITYLESIIKPQYERFHEKAQSVLNPSELLMFKELQILALDLNLEISRNDTVLIESLLQFIIAGKQSAYGDEDMDWVYRVCRVTKNTNSTVFDTLFDLIKKEYPDDCEKWLGLQCSRHEQNFIDYIETFFEKFSSNCTCRTLSISHFLQMDFIDGSWSKAWKRFVTLISNIETKCKNTIFNYIQSRSVDLQPRNVEKFKDTFKEEWKELQSVKPEYPEEQPKLLPIGQ